MKGFNNKFLVYFASNIINTKMEKIPRNLNLIFWGIILAVVDIDFYAVNNQIGMQIDFLPDIVGAIMICVGVFNIAKIPVSNPLFSSSMLFVKIATLLFILLSVDDFFIYIDSSFTYYTRQFFSIIIDFSMVVFCVAMIILSKEKELTESFKNWKIARNLFLFVYVLPYLLITIFSTLHIFYIHQLGSFSFSVVLPNSEAYAISPVIVVFMLLIFLLSPIIYGLSCLYSMQGEIEIQQIKKSN